MKRWRKTMYRLSGLISEEERKALRELKELKSRRKVRAKRNKDTSQVEENIKNKSKDILKIRKENF